MTLMTTHLTQRDRIMVAEVIRRYLARDIEARGIVDTYKADVLSVLAFDLAEFADELVNCCDGDSVDLAEAVAGDLADFGGTDDYVACDLADLLAPIPTLSKLDDALNFGPAVATKDPST